MMGKNDNAREENIALIFQDKRISYSKLDKMSDVIANILRDNDVRRNDIVPVIARRSWQGIVAMIGVLKSGGAYLPISPGYPMERVNDMLSECAAKTVLTFGYDMSFHAQTIIRLDEVDFNKKTAAVKSINTPDDICYVLYTSGSTGKAKAVMIKHRSLVNFMDNNPHNTYQNTFVETSRCVLADTNFVFDISIFEVFLSLLYGKTVVLTEEMATPKEIAELIENHGVDTIHTTPTKLKLWMSDSGFQSSFSQIRLLMCGAEAFTDDLFQQIRKYSKAIVYNGYGPTEITIGCCFKRIEEVA